MSKKIQIQEEGGCGDVLTAEITSEGLYIECDEPWAGDTDTGLGRSGAVTLSAARAEADRCRSMVASGQDPSESRKAAKAEQQKAAELERAIASGGPVPGTFRADAAAWMEYQRARWSDRTACMITARSISKSAQSLCSGGRTMWTASAALNRIPVADMSPELITHRPGKYPYKNA